MADNDWWTPEKLKSSEEQIKSINDGHVLRSMGDFGTYKDALLNGITDESPIHSHNDLNPEKKIKALLKYIAPLPKDAHILDVGCGLGFASKALAELIPGASVLGVDISSDAIKFAKERFTKADFLCTAISPDEQDLGKFDFIFCFEFYPFTRNSDLNVQIAYIDYFAGQLKHRGKIIIVQNWNNQNSLAPLLPDVIKNRPTLQINLYKTPNLRILQYFSKAFFISKFLNFAISQILRRDISFHFLIIAPKRSE
jgi:2-polyprenyl-3-methyl-5-hydroxy-6-metoxy-1,4-benzoquinol methylase